MSAALHLAAPEDSPKLLAMIEAYHNEIGVGTDLAARAHAVSPLLAGSPHGAVWLIGPRAAPVGYIAISFGWSLSLGGLEGRIDEFFIRRTVRGRGVGTEVLVSLINELEGGGLAALILDPIDADSRIARICQRLGFQGGARQILTRTYGATG